MSHSRLQTLIESAYGDLGSISPQTTGDVREAVDLRSGFSTAAKSGWPRDFWALSGRARGKSISG